MGFVKAQLRMLKVLDLLEDDEGTTHKTRRNHKLKYHQSFPNLYTTGHSLQNQINLDA